MANRILNEFRNDMTLGIPGAHDPYEWVTRGWMDAAEAGFFRGIYLPFKPTPAEASVAARVILRIGRIKGVRPASVVGTPAEVINTAFGIEVVPVADADGEKE